MMNMDSIGNDLSTQNRMKNGRENNQDMKPSLGKDEQRDFFYFKPPVSLLFAV